jgi:hypothetical protein
VFVLLIFSVILLPLLNWTKNSSAAFKAFYLVLLPVPLFLIKMLNPTIQLGGYDLLFYLVVVIYGFYLFKDRLFTEVLSKYPHTVIISPVFSSALWTAGFYQEWNALILAGIQVLYCWSSILVIFHLAAEHLRFTNPALHYFSEASMPYYVLHQPIIVMAGFFLRDWEIPVVLKFLLLAGIAYISIAVLYHFAVKPYAWPRILTGLNGKTSGKHSKSSPEEASLS